MSNAAKLLVAVAVPAAIALTAFLNATAIGALVGASIAPGDPAPPIAASPAPPAPRERPSAKAILARNMFDHVTGPIHAPEETTTPEAAPRNDDPRSAPPCNNVRALVAVRSFDADASFAALEASGKRVLRHRGDAVEDGSPLKVAYVGEDRVWLDDGTALCQARIGAKVDVAPPPRDPKDQPKNGGDGLAEKLKGKIVKSGPTEWQVDRGAVDQLLEAQAELMKVPLVPEKEGDKVVGMKIMKLKQGSAVALLGLEEGDRLVSVNGIEVTSPEKVLEVYARLKAGVLDRITIHVVRKGKPTNLDYTIR